MSLQQIFSFTQILGYLAFVLGVASFLQKSDLRFKLFMAAECLAYIVHFFMLGVYTPVASSRMSFLRSVVAIKTRAPAVAFAFVAGNLLLGWWLAESWVNWLPIMASCIGTLALFLLEGVRMRWLMLVGTLLWLLNNILSGSIGGTMLELTVACANLYTIRKLSRQGAA